MPTPEEIDKDIIGMLRSLSERLDMVSERQRHHVAFIDNLIDRMNEVEARIKGMQQQLLFWLEGRSGVG